MSKESQFYETAPYPCPPGKLVCALPIPAPGCEFAKATRETCPTHAPGRPLDAFYCILPTGHAGPCKGIALPKTVQKPA